MRVAGIARRAAPARASVHPGGRRSEVRMGPGHHHHHRDFSHGDGFVFWWLWPIAAGLMILVLLSAAYDLGLADGVRAWLAGGSRQRWRSAVLRHREIAAAFAAYECDPQAVLRR